MQDVIQKTITQIGTVVLGKEHQIKLALTCLISGGHLLIEDLPGMGKTTLSQTLAKVLGLSFNRIQFTSDLLPADILGISIFEKDSGRFTFHPGPIFNQLILADEINRATPKSQSALLEAMEEHHVSVDGNTMPLPQPFFVMATKNPFEEVGTFELPSSQLDRFAISISLGYPDKTSERELLRASAPLNLDGIVPICKEDIDTLKNAIKNIHISDEVLDFIQEALDFTRNSGLYHSGLSTRAALALVKLSKAYALMQERDFLMPSDVIALLPYVTAHRLRALNANKIPKQISDEILSHLHPDR